MKKKFSVALSSQKQDVLTKHLLRNSGSEDLCFALWKPSEGHTRYTGLITEIVLPLPGDRNLHGNASFNPKYFERVLSMAAKKDAGIVFLHSHLTPGWQGMSFDDVHAELQMAGSVFAVTSLPLIGMTLGTDGAWSARRWDKTASRKFEPTWAVSVRTVGDILNATFYDKLVPRPKFKEDFARTISAWGDDAQARLMRLHIVVVGVGSVGSVVAEALAMMGVQRITLIDFDIFKKINRDRSVGVTKSDLGKSKVSVIARHLEKVATADDFQVKTVDYSIVELEGFLAALDGDLIFSCVDRPWPRSVLNAIAITHLIPVIDGGIKARQSKTGTLLGADWRAHTVTPGRKCMECLGQFSPSDVSLEKEGFLDDPAYIEGLPRDHYLRSNENVFGFSLSVAGMEIQQALSLIIHPSGIGNIGSHHYHFVTGETKVKFEDCDETCLYKTHEAQGDRSELVWHERHVAAETSRTDRNKRQ